MMILERFRRWLRRRRLLRRLRSPKVEPPAKQRGQPLQPCVFLDELNRAPGINGALLERFEIARRMEPQRTIPRLMLTTSATDQEPAPATAAINNLPGLTITPETMEAISLFCENIREAARIATEGILAFAEHIQEIGAATGMLVADMIRIQSYATPAELHRMEHARKARTRKKYRNRVLRRIRMADKRRHRHG